MMGSPTEASISSGGRSPFGVVAEGPIGCPTTAVSFEVATDVDAGAALALVEVEATALVAATAPIVATVAVVVAEGMIGDATGGRIEVPIGGWAERWVVPAGGGPTLWMERLPPLPATLPGAGGCTPNERRGPALPILPGAGGWTPKERGRDPLPILPTLPGAGGWTPNVRRLPALPT